MDQAAQYVFTNISGRTLRPRQMEYHKSIPNKIVMGTTTGSVYEIFSDCSQPVRILADVGIDDKDQVLGLCWFRHHDSKYVAGTMGGNIYFGDSIKEYDPASRHSCQLKYDFSHLTSLHVNADDSIMSTSGYNHHVCMYDTTTLQKVIIYENAHDDDINITRFANQSPHLFLSCSGDKSAKLWDLRMKPHHPIYSVVTPTRLTTITFHLNDIYFLTSGEDNHVHQYLVLDGRLHHQYKLPQINSEINFTRSYYSCSGAYVVSGASEEDFLSICEVNTGDVVRRIRLYPGRTHDSLYVQSLRGASTNDLEVTVLVNYAEYGDREMIKVALPSNAYPKMPMLSKESDNRLTVSLQPFTTLHHVSDSYKAGLRKLYDSIATSCSGLVILTLGTFTASAHAYILSCRCSKLADVISYQSLQPTISLDSLLPFEYGSLLPLIIKYLYTDDISVTDMQMVIREVIEQKGVQENIAVLDILAKLMHTSQLLQLSSLSDELDRIICGMLCIPLVFEVAYISTLFERIDLFAVCLHFALRFIHILESARPPIPSIYLEKEYQDLFAAPPFEPEQFLDDVRLKALEMRTTLLGNANLESCNMFGLSSLPIVRVGSVTTVLDRLLLFIGGHNSMHWYSPKRLLSFDPVTSSWAVLTTYGSYPEGLFSITVTPLQKRYTSKLVVICSEKYRRDTNLSVFTLDISTMTWFSPRINGRAPMLSHGSVFASTAAFYHEDTSDSLPCAEPLHRMPACGLSYIVAYSGALNAEWLEDVVVLQPLSGSSEAEFAWSHPRILGRSPQNIRNATVVPIAGKCFPDHCNRVVVICLSSSQGAIAVLKCHSASLMEWENIEISGVPGNGRVPIHSIRTVGPNVIGAISASPMKIHLAHVEMVHQRLTMRWETTLIDVKPQRNIDHLFVNCMHGDHKLFVYGGLGNDSGSFTDMINLHRLEDGSYYAEPPRPNVMIVPDEEPLLPPRRGVVQENMLALLQCPSQADFRVHVDGEFDETDITFNVHRPVLQSQWEFMDRLLHSSSDFKETEDGLIRCADNINCIETLLIFVYSGILCIEDTDMISLIQVANKYQLQSLLLACEGVLVQMVDKDNCLNLLLWANKFFLKNLADVAITVYIRNHQDIDISCSVDEETYDYVEGIRKSTVHAYIIENSDPVEAENSVHNSGAA